VIHGDLNLENILVGPGDLVWLIDFASTREGHTLYDFARLEVELTTQVVAEILSHRGSWMEAFLIVLDGLHRNVDALDGPLGEIYLLLSAVRRIARRCLYDPADSKEFYRTLLLAYLGCLKFANLDQLSWAPMSKALAFLAAAYLMDSVAM
jgi:Ser/Thr protein kinase RdoA (MazF antagonist)